MTDRTPEEEAFVHMLIDWGALYVGGVDDSGDELYFMNAEVMKDVCRPFYDMWMADIDKGLLELEEDIVIYDKKLRELNNPIINRIFNAG